MTVNIKDIPTISDLKRRRDQVTSRIGRIAQVTTLAGMAELINGLEFDQEIIEISRMQVGQYLAMKKKAMDDQLVALGVDLKA